VMTALIAFVGETLAPWGERNAQALAAGAKSSDRITSGKTGLWAREGDDLFNAKSGRSTARGVELFDVRLYEFTPAGQLRQITRAGRAEHEGVRWQLFDAVRMKFLDERIETETVPMLEWKSTLDPRLLSLSVVRPRYLSGRDLRANIEYLQRNQLDAAPYEAAFWSRVFYPVNVLALLLFTLPFAFGALRSGGLAKRLFFGVLVAVAWLLFQRAIVNVAEVYSVDFRLAHGLPALALLGFSVFYFRRAS
jgi:lipopolysaccharide export system permease protein